MRFHQRIFKTLALAACGFALWSCTPDNPPEKGGAGALDQPKLKAGFFPSDQKIMQQDATPPVDYLIQLTSYRITVPAGTISKSEDFWKHIDEHAVDVATYDLLYKNGMRVGVAASTEWEYLKDILKQNPAITQPSAYAGREAKDIEMEMKLAVPLQNLFYYDTHGDLIGQTYERCDNLIRMSFQPAPRKPGTVRLGLCPIVRSLHEWWIPHWDGTSTRYELVRPTQIYDLNLTTDIPLDSFLIVAPSEEGKWPTSLGSNFLIGDGATEQTETLLIFRPVVYRQRVGVASTQP